MGGQRTKQVLVVEDDEAVAQVICAAISEIPGLRATAVGDEIGHFSVCGRIVWDLGRIRAVSATHR